MAKELRVKAKYTDLLGSENHAIMVIGVFDSVTDEEFPATFVQPSNLTAAVAGITDYGMIIFNTVDSDMDDDVTIAAVVAGVTVSETLPLEDLILIEPGAVVEADDT